MAIDWEKPLQIDREVFAPAFAGADSLFAPHETRQWLDVVRPSEMDEGFRPPRDVQENDTYWVRRTDRQGFPGGAFWIKAHTWGSMRGMIRNA